MKKILVLILTLVLGLTSLTGCKNEENVNTSDLENETIKLSSIYRFLDNSSDTYIKVRKEKGNIGVAPGSLNEISYSNEDEDIKKVLKMLHQDVKKVDNDMMTPGGSYLEYRFYTNEEKYDAITITNNLIVYNREYYLLSEAYDLKLQSDKQIYSLLTDSEAFKVYKNKEYVGDFNKVNELEFIKIDVIKKEPLLTIDCGFFTIYVLSKDEFYREKPNDDSYEYFKVVSNVDFSSLI